MSRIKMPQFCMNLNAWSKIMKKIKSVLNFDVIFEMIHYIDWRCRRFGSMKLFIRFQQKFYKQTEKCNKMFIAVNLWKNNEYLHTFKQIISIYPSTFNTHLQFDHLETKSAHVLFQMRKKSVKKIKFLVE